MHDIGNTITVTRDALKRGHVSAHITGEERVPDVSIVALIIGGILYGSWVHPEEYEAIIPIQYTHQHYRNAIIEWYRRLPDSDRALLRVDRDFTLIDERSTVPAFTTPPAVLSAPIAVHNDA